LKTETDADTNVILRSVITKKEHLKLMRENQEEVFKLNAIINE